MGIIWSQDSTSTAKSLKKLSCKAAVEEGGLVSAMETLKSYFSYGSENEQRQQRSQLVSLVLADLECNSYAANSPPSRCVSVPQGVLCILSQIYCSGWCWATSVGITISCDSTKGDTISIWTWFEDVKFWWDKLRVLGFRSLVVLRNWICCT